jgi:integral membrane protein (TIGR00529 family)
MEWLLSFPAYAKILGTFLGILLLNRFGASLGVAILAFALLLTAWTGTGWSGFAYQVEMFRQPENALLPLIILLLLFFSDSLKRTGRMDRTIAGLKAWLQKKHLIIAGLPALVGLLPMPAGALFSAPFVAAMDEEKELRPAHKVAINYWFRHIWEYWWPLYPGVILAMHYANIPALTYFLIQVPFTAAAILGGYFFILRGIGKGREETRENSSWDAPAVFAAIRPIGVLVLTTLLGSALLPPLGVHGTLANLVAMLAGLVLALATVFAGHGSAFRPALSLFGKKETWLMVILVLGIQAFSAALLCPLDAAGGNLVTGMRDELVRTGIPLVTIAMAIPFISGMVTGVAFGFVGASFPIVFALLGPEPSLALTAATTSFAYTFGYMGMMLSPMHACFVVTAEYFHTPIFGAYRYLIGPASVMILTAVLLSAAWYTLL